MDRRNLELIEERTRQGQEVHVVRVLSKKDGLIRKIALLSDKDSELFSKPLYEVIRAMKTEMVASRVSADMKEINYGSGRFAKVVVEGLRPKVKLVVFGAGHVGQAVGLIGALLGFDVVLVDDRPEFASRKRLPDPRIRLIVGDYGKVIADLNVNSNSAVVIVTRGHQFDEICLRGTIRSGASYLGMIGSKRRVLSVINKLEKDGFAKSDFENLHAPIGLRIGARSPQEIAVAILAEVINHFNGKNVK